MAEVRKIIHVDMDAFFAAVEQRDHPELRGKPVAVGHDGPRGVVSTASYEARKFGVHSAMAMTTAKHYCPQLIIVPGNHQHYNEVSQQVHRIFEDYTDKIEPVSIDEAFLDVTDNKKGISDAEAIAENIRSRIREELGLTASAGISYNKFLAKIASDFRKPDGQFAVRVDDALDFIGRLPVEKIWGVGAKTKEKMRQIGVYTGSDLRAMSLQYLREVFGKAGELFYDFARGIDPRPVEVSWKRKAVGCEHTLEDDITMPSQMIIELYHVVLELERRLAKSGFKGRTLTLKIKYGDFKTISRSLTVDNVLMNKEDILPLAKKLLGKVEFSASHSVRLVGLSVSNHNEDEECGPHWIQGRLDFGGDFWD